MARVRVEKPEADCIAALIRAFAAEAPEELQGEVPYVAQFQALPVHVGWTATIGIRPDGTLIMWSTEGEFEGAREVEEGVFVRVALMEAVRRFPDLRDLVPPRPPGARTCEQCGGVGHLPGIPGIYCYCGGFGWVEEGEPGR
jgi:hypothetical protein